MKIFNPLIKKRDKVFSEYPCDVYLHNALFFITNDKPDVAYREICWAILKSGGNLQKKNKQSLRSVRTMLNKLVPLRDCPRA